MASPGLGPAVAALASMIPEALGRAGELCENVAAELSLDELRAVKAFAYAGSRCLNSLSEKTMSQIRRHCNDNDSLRASLGRFPSSQTLGINGCRRGSETSKAGELRGIEALFAEFDTDADNRLTREEFKVAFTQLGGEQFSEREIDIIWNIADADGNGSVDLAEFARWLAHGGTQITVPGALQQSESQRLAEALAMKDKELEKLRSTMDREKEQFEEEMEACLEFWRCIAASSATSMLPEKLDLESVDWLGSGNYGQVFKCRRRKDDRSVVVKLMGIRWAHVAVKEWQHGSAIGHHDNVVEHEDVILHADDGNVIKDLLKAGYAAGKLKSKQRRAKFPDHFVCIIQEFMNRGTVQNWMDEGLLLPGGMFVVMRSVASALKFLHWQGVTHNDIKPENVLLRQDEASGPKGQVTVKLADLGLAQRSRDRAADFQQYALTVFCMATGERFGSRKFRPEKSEEYSRQVANIVGTGKSQDRVIETMRELPVLLRKLFGQQVDMCEVEEMPSLHDWGFFDDVDDGTREMLPDEDDLDVPEDDSLSDIELSPVHEEVKDKLQAGISPARRKSVDTVVSTRRRSILRCGSVVSNSEELLDGFEFKAAQQFLSEMSGTLLPSDQTEPMEEADP